MHPTPGQTFAARLRQERERVQIGQAEFARRVSRALGETLDASAMTRIEKGGRAVKIDEAVAMAEVLGLPLAALLEEGDALGERIDDLRRDLIQAQEAVVGHEEQLRRARASVVAIQRSIDELEASRSEKLDEL